MKEKTDITEKRLCSGAAGQLYHSDLPLKKEILLLYDSRKDFYGESLGSLSLKERKDSLIYDEEVFLKIRRVLEKRDDFSKKALKKAFFTELCRLFHKGAHKAASDGEEDLFEFNQSISLHFGYLFSYCEAVLREKPPRRELEELDIAKAFREESSFFSEAFGLFYMKFISPQDRYEKSREYIAGQKIKNRYYEEALRLLEKETVRSVTENAADAVRRGNLEKVSFRNIRAKEAAAFRAPLQEPAPFEEEEFAGEFARHLWYLTAERTVCISGFLRLAETASPSLSDKKKIVNLSFARLGFWGFSQDDESGEARNLLAAALAENYIFFVLSKERTRLFKKGKKEKKAKEAKDLRFLEKSIEDAVKENRRLSEELSKKEKELEKLSRKDEVKELREKLYRAERKAEEEKRKNEIAREKIKVLREPEAPAGEETEGEERSFSDEDLRELIRGKKILLWGVREKDAKIFREFDEVKCFVNEKTRGLSPAALDGTDAALLAVNNTSHTRYWEIKKMLDAKGIPYVHLNRSDNNKERLYEGFRRLLEKKEASSGEDSKP